MKKWRCSVCGYIHEGEFPPDKCPNCGAPAEKFSEISDDFESIFMHYAQKASYGNEIEVNPFFGDYKSLAPFIYNLPPGKRSPLHKHPTTDEIFFVIKGRINFTVGDKQFVAEKGDVIEGKMDIPHRFENIGDTPAIFLSVKAPKPVDLLIVEE